MKIKNITIWSLLSYLCIPALLGAPVSASAATLQTTPTGIQFISVMNQQTEDEAGDEKTENSKPAAHKDQAAEDEKRKKYCATARKNLELLRSNMEERTFTTEEGKIVKYTPYQLKKMIEESEAAEKANCD